MVISLVLYVVYAVLYGLLSVTILLLPDVTANSTVTAAIATVVPYAAVINLVIPLDTIFAIFSASIAIFVTVSLYRIILWIIRLIRG